MIMSFGRLHFKQPEIYRGKGGFNGRKAKYVLRIVGSKTGPRISETHTHSYMMIE